MKSNSIFKQPLPTSGYSGSQLAPVAAALTAAFLLIGAGGCGDDQKTTLSKAQYIKQADAICKSADEEQRAGFAKHQSALSGVTETKARRRKAIQNLGLPPIKREVAELSALEAPPEAEEIVAAIQKALSQAEARPFSVSAGVGPFRQVNEMASRYGFKICSDAL